MRPDSGSRSLRSTRLERGLLWGFAGFTLVTLVGYATFGTNPALLARFPEAAPFYGLAFRFFALSHVVLSFVVLAAFLFLRVRLRWLVPFAALYAISLASETAGTSVGLPFGEYAYSALLAPMWFGKVPVVIPLSWFAMALPSYALAMRALPGARRTAARIAFASVVLLAWDLSLDPAMSHATAYWVWAGDGPYYGMPWLNLAGWYVTGVALMGALAATRSERWIAALPTGWLAGFYAANLLLPLGMNAAAGLWTAVLATAAVLAVLALPFAPALRAPAAPVRAEAR
jgi:uncharacterized membrane protein